MAKNRRTGRETRSPDVRELYETRQYFLHFNWDGVYRRVAKALGLHYSKSGKKSIDNEDKLF